MDNESDKEIEELILELAESKSEILKSIRELKELVSLYL